MQGFVVGDKEEEGVTTELSTDDIIFAFLKDSGSLYTFESKQKWYLVLARSTCAAITFGVPEANGIQIQFETVGPTVEELMKSAEIRTHIQELNFSQQSCSVFLTSPRELLQEKVKSETIGSGEQKRWMVVTLPFKDTADVEKTRFDPFLFIL